MTNDDVSVIDGFKLFDFLSTNLKPPHNDGLCTLNQEQVKLYLMKVDKPYAIDAENIIKNTTYVSHSTFVDSLFKSVEIFKKSIGNTPFKLIYGQSRLCSEHLCIAILWQKLKELNMIDVIHVDKTESSPHKECIDYVWIDDAIYTGANMSYVVGRLKHEENVNFHAILAYSCDTAIDNCRLRCSSSVNLKIHSGHQLPTFYDRYGRSIPALYFDHKLASGCTFNYIYEGITSNPIMNQMPSRKIIEDLQTLVNRHYKQSNVHDSHKINHG